MVVNASTFARLRAGSVARVVQSAEVRLPSPLHLVAMKLSSMGQRPGELWMKDWLDVIELIKQANLDVRAEEFRAIVLRYSSLETYERILALFPAS